MTDLMAGLDGPGEANVSEALPDRLAREVVAEFFPIDETDRAHLNTSGWDAQDTELAGLVAAAIRTALDEAATVAREIADEHDRCPDVAHKLFRLGYEAAGARIAAMTEALKDGPRAAAAEGTIE